MEYVHTYVKHSRVPGMTFMCSKWGWFVEKRNGKEMQAIARGRLVKESRYNQVSVQGLHSIEFFVSLPFVIQKVIVIHYYQCPQHQSAFPPL